MPAPSAVKICTENAAARVRRRVDESWRLIWFICPAGLSGIVPICTSAVAAIRRASRLEPVPRGCGLENAAGNVNCSGMNDTSATYDVAVVGGGPAGLSCRDRAGAGRRKTALIARRAPYADNRTTALLGGSVDFLQGAGRVAALQGQRGGAAGDASGRRYRPADPRPRGAVFGRRNRPRRIRLQHRKPAADGRAGRTRGRTSGADAVRR